MPSNTSDNTWPVGCQLRPWLQTLGTEELARRLPQVMVQIAEMGFIGFETNIACLPLAQPRAFRDAAARANNLILAAAHTGGRWWDPANEATLPSVVAMAKRLPDLGCQRLALSMTRTPTAAYVKHAALTLAYLGKACRQEAGVKVVFHNHAAELEEDARVLQAIVEECAPENVALGPDLGWVAHAGVDVVEFIERFGSRIDYVHVRDVTAYGSNGGFIEIGRGVLDHAAILAALRSHGYRGWLMAESEFGLAWRGALDPLASAALQFAGLRTHCARVPAYP